MTPPRPTATPVPPLTEYLSEFGAVIAALKVTLETLKVNTAQTRFPFNHDKRYHSSGRTICPDGEGSGKFWKTKWTSGSCASNCSIAGAAFAQCGHCISLNSTIVTAALAGPFAGPLTPFSSLARASSNGFAPKGRTSPVITCLPSELTNNRFGFAPCAFVITTETSANPGISDGRISFTFHVMVGS